MHCRHKNPSLYLDFLWPAAASTADEITDDKER